MYHIKGGIPWKKNVPSIFLLRAIKGGEDGTEGGMHGLMDTAQTGSFSTSDSTDNRFAPEDGYQACRNYSSDYHIKDQFYTRTDKR